MSGLDLTSGKSAAINVQSKAALYIHLEKDTENHICDSGSRDDEHYYPEGVSADDEKRNGAIYCKGSIVFSGKGILELDGKKKHGISAKSSVTVRPGVTLAVNDVADNCIKAEGITVLGGYIWAKTSADAGKCLSSDADVDIREGMFKFYTSGGSIYEEEENDTSSPAGVKADGNMTVSVEKAVCCDRKQIPCRKQCTYQQYSRSYIREGSYRCRQGTLCQIPLTYKARHRRNSH